MSQLDFTLFLVHFLNVISLFYLFLFLVVFLITEKLINDLIRKKKRNND